MLSVLRLPPISLLVAATIVTILAATIATSQPPAVQPTPPVTEVGPPAEHIAWEVVSRRPHDPEAWTQGLVLDTHGRLFESTGRYGHSSLREVDSATGAVERLVSLPDDVFGEGLASVDDRLIQLTWKNGIAYAWSADTFEPQGTFDYEGEGWGLCHDGLRLVMSDGSATLTFRDAATFAPLGSVAVTLDGQPQAQLNELECVEGSVWANVYKTDRIVRIDPDSGAVTGVVDTAGLIDPHPEDARTGAVLNGIAYDAKAGTFLLTGKLWPELIEVRLLDDAVEEAL